MFGASKLVCQYDGTKCDGAGRQVRRDDGAGRQVVDTMALETRLVNAIELAARLVAELPSLRRRHHDRGKNSHMTSMAGIIAAIPKRPMLLG